MLRFLRITHLAVIDKAEVEFEPGFNVLTGETGAGKSILVEAVGLLLGGRAAADLVRTGEETASVDASEGARHVRSPVFDRNCNGERLCCAVCCASRGGDRPNGCPRACHPP